MLPFLRRLLADCDRLSVGSRVRTISRPWCRATSTTTQRTKNLKMRISLWAWGLPGQLTPSSSTRRQWHFIMVQITVSNSCLKSSDRPVPWIRIKCRRRHQLSVQKFCCVFLCNVLLRADNHLANGKHLHHCEGWKSHSLLMISWFSGWLHLQVVFARFVTGGFYQMSILSWLATKLT